MEDNENINLPEITQDEKELEKKIVKEIEKLKFFVEDAEELYANNETEELNAAINKANEIQNRINDIVSNMQELKLEREVSPRTIRQWRKDLKTTYAPLYVKKSNLITEVELKQREAREKAEKADQATKQQEQQQLREEIKEQEKEAFQARLKAELEMTEKKIEMEKMAKACRTKLPELKITPFKGTPGDWVRFENMFLTQIDRRDVTDAEKFGYLLELVGEKVRNRLSNLKPGKMGYDTAWQRLKSEYGHSKTVIAAHMDEIINLQTVRGTNYERVRSFYEKLSNNYDALQTLGEADSLRSLTTSTINKLPHVKPDLVRIDDDWEDWTLENLIAAIQKWLKRHRVDEPYKAPETRKEKNFYGRSGDDSKKRNPKCFFCNEEHWADACTTFDTIEKRKSFFSDKRLCFNCARHGHQGNECRGKGCYKCKGRHHTSLCMREDCAKGAKAEGVLNGYTPVEKSLPAIIPIKVGDKTLWAFLDTGSGRNYISSEAARKLNLYPEKHENQNIVTISGIKKQSMPLYKLVIKSIDNKNENTIEVVGSKMPDFTTIVRPPVKEIKEKYPHAQGKTFYYNAADKYQIDLILSDSFYCKIRTETIFKGQPDDPIVEETSYGWVIHGGTEYSDNNCLFTKQVDNYYEQLYSLVVLGVKDRGEKDSLQVYEDFKENVVRQDDGRYEVSIPWIPGAKLEGNNETSSRRRLANVERKLTQNESVETAYSRKSPARGSRGISPPPQCRPDWGGN